LLRRATASAGSSRAAEELKHVTRADPDDLEAWVALGVAERGHGNFDAAERAFERALEIDPDDPDSLYDLAVLHMEWKKAPERARNELARFLKVAPTQHDKRADAQARRKELAPKAPAAPAPLPSEKTGAN
jgi:Flp pilus assembly protein TadD